MKLFLGILGLAAYFLKVCTMVPVNDINPLDPIVVSNSMTDLIISKEFVLKKLNVLKINTSPGPDLIHPKVLYELRDVISPYLCHLFEQSILQGKIPNDWKMSSVTVIHKKGKKNCVENYRPISLTCITCKIIWSRLLEIISCITLRVIISSVNFNMALLLVVLYLYNY